MIRDLKPYPEYRDSGVEWLGGIPAHWEVRRQRGCVRVLVSNTDKRVEVDEIPVRLCNYTDVYRNDRITGRLGFLRATATPEEVERFRLRVGDVIITKDSESWTDIGVPALVECEAPDLLCGYHLALLRPRHGVVYGGFLLRAIQSPGVACQYHIGANGVTRYGLSLGAIKDVLIPVPRFLEQIGIARFIDHVDRRIRRYIRSKQKLIALLNEQKQAIVHRAVTRGLDPHVRLRPSGNVWFPELPRHWSLLSLRRVIHTAVDGPHYSPSYLDSGIPFLSARNIKADRWSLEDVKFVSEEDYRQFCKRVVPEPGDVLYTKGGTTGVARVVDLGYRFQVWVHVAVLKVNRRRVTSEFLAATLNTPRCYEQSQLFTRGATNQDLGLARMKDIVLPVPPVSEQEAIVRFLGDMTAGFGRAINAAQREISLLREYRTRLIADVVTGKLDVREAAAHLPEETGEPEPLDDIDTSPGDISDETQATDPDAALEEAEA